VRSCNLCKYFIPAWGGSKTSMSQPAWCFKRSICLTNEFIQKGCKECVEFKEVEADAAEN
jgi:hypothetical protein